MIRQVKCRVIHVSLQNFLISASASVAVLLKSLNLCRNRRYRAEFFFTHSRNLSREIGSAKRHLVYDLNRKICMMACQATAFTATRRKYDGYINHITDLQTTGSNMVIRFIESLHNSRPPILPHFQYLLPPRLYSSAVHRAA